jgi:tRNA threonylcarbamoyladenosine biosynthesis protein TsaB
MAFILNIETATQVCSVALAKDGRIVSLRERNEGLSHAEWLTVFIQEVMQEAGLHLSQLDAIAVSSGPGSYTGLRIGVSTAKGLCFSLDKPLIAVSTLKSMAHGFLTHLSSGPFPGDRGATHLSPDPFPEEREKKIEESSQVLSFGKDLGWVPPTEKDLGWVLPTKKDLGWVLPMIDARRMEVYCAAYDKDLNEMLPVSAKIIETESFSYLLERGKVFFIGDGAEKCKNILSSPNAVFVGNIFPSASFMASLSEEHFNAGKFENLAMYEPFYLKDFVAGKKSAVL